MVEVTIIAAATGEAIDGIQHTSPKSSRRNGVSGKGMCIHTRREIEEGYWDTISHSDIVGYGGMV